MSGKAYWSIAQAARERRLADEQHRPGIVVARSKLAERRERGDVAALFGEVGHERHDEVALADRIENVRGTQQFMRRCGAPVLAASGSQRDLFEAEPGARQLAIIGGGIAGSGLVLRAHLLELAGRLGGAAAPVGGTRADDRIRRAFVDMGEMLSAVAGSARKRSAIQPAMKWNSAR